MRHLWHCMLQSSVVICRWKDKLEKQNTGTNLSEDKRANADPAVDWIFLIYFQRAIVMLPVHKHLLLLCFRRSTSTQWFHRSGRGRILLLSTVARQFVSLAEVPDNRCFSYKRLVFDVSRQRFRFACCMRRGIGQPELGSWLDRMQWIGKYIRVAVTAAVRMVVVGRVVTFVWSVHMVVIDVGGRGSLGD